MPVSPAPSLIALLNPMQGLQVLPSPDRTLADGRRAGPDLGEVKG